MNFDVVAKYVARFAKEIETQPESNNEFVACKDVYDKWLQSLNITSIVELGAGTSPMIKLFPNVKQPIRLSLGKEQGVLSEDMNTPAIDDNVADLVIARHALEHSLMPLIMLCEMARISSHYVLVIVPTCTQEMANYPNHYSVFTPVALEALFKRAGLMLIQKELDVPLYANICEDRYLLEKI